MLILTPPGAAWGRKRARIPACLSRAASGSGSSTSRKRKLPPPLRTLSMPGAAPSRSASRSRSALIRRILLLVDRAPRRRERGEGGGDARARQRVGRQRPRRHRDQLGIADRRADPRAGQAIGLRQGAQHDEVRPLDRLGREALRRRKLDIGLVEDDDRLGQRLGDAKHLGRVDDVAGRIVRRAEEDELQRGFVDDPFDEAVGVELEILARAAPRPARRPGARAKWA